MFVDFCKTEIAELRANLRDNAMGYDSRHLAYLAKRIFFVERMMVSARLFAESGKTPEEYLTGLEKMVKSDPDPFDCAQRWRADYDLVSKILSKCAEADWIKDYHKWVTNRPARVVPG